MARATLEKMTVTPLHTALAQWQAQRAAHDIAAQILGLSEAMCRLSECVGRMFTDGSSQSNVTAVFLSEETERDMLAALLQRRARQCGAVAKVTSAQWGQWAREATKDPNEAVHILVGQHEKQYSPAVLARMRDRQLAAILLWPLAAQGTEQVPEGATQISLGSLATRPEDRSLYFLIEVLAALELKDADETARVANLLNRLLEVLPLLAAGSTFDALRDYAGRTTEFLTHWSGLHPSEDIDFWALQNAVVDRPSSEPPPTVRRLWVEGTTDKKLFELTAALFAESQKDCTNLLDGIVVQSFDGCAKVHDALASCRAERALEMFLFDNDDDGRRARTSVLSAGASAYTLDKNATAASCQRDWVIEDLISVEAIDRFYAGRPDTNPLREEITFAGEERGRRMLVGGDDKLPLVDWLTENGTSADVSGLAAQLITVRNAFALRAHRLPELHTRSRAGLRPEPWWYLHG